MQIVKQWDSTAFIIWHFWILPLWYSCLRFQEPGNRNNSLTTNHSFPSPRPVLLPLMHEGNATVGRMSLSVGLDVGQGGGARVDYSVALPLVYMHCCCRPRVDYSGHSPKSDTSCWPATLLQSQVHPSLETLQLLDKGWLTGGTIAWDTFGFLRTSNLRIPCVIKSLHRRDP